MSLPRVKYPHPFLMLAVGALIAAFAIQRIETATIDMWPIEPDDPRAAVVWLPAAPQTEITWIDGYEEGPFVSAKAALLLENTTGTVLYAKNALERRAPASTTKILTALLAMEQGQLSDVVTVSRRAAATTGSTARLYTGQLIRMEHLLHGLLLSSGNDAAVAVAEHLAGSEATFVHWMNQRAASLGAVNTRFANPHGLDDPGHYSTAYDLALLSRFALLYPKFAEIVQTRSYSSEEGSWFNTNELLWRFDGATGIKTGTTSKAGYCLVASATRDGMQLIAVVLDASDRYADSRRLLDHALENFQLITVAEPGDVLATIPLARGLEPVVAVASRPLSVVVPDHQGARLSTRLTIDPTLKAPIRRGQTLGTFDVLVGDQVLQHIPLIAEAPVDTRTPWTLLKRWLRRQRAAPRTGDAGVRG